MDSYGNSFDSPAYPPVAFTATQLPVVEKMADVSNNNGVVNWAALKAQGITIIAAKATEWHPAANQLFVDPYYERNRRGAASIGARFMAYAFAHPSSSAAGSWDFFAEHAALGDNDAYACDLEESDGLTAAEVSAWGSAFAHAGYGATGAWPFAYSYRDFIAAGNLDGMRVCPLWIAIPGPTAPTEPVTFDGWHSTIIQWGKPNGIDADSAFFPLDQWSRYTVRGGSNARTDARLARAAIDVADHELRIARGLLDKAARG